MVVERRINFVAFPQLRSHLFGDNRVNTIMLSPPFSPPHTLCR